MWCKLLGGASVITCCRWLWLWLSRRAHSRRLHGGCGMAPAEAERARRLAISDPLYSQQWHLVNSKTKGNDINVLPAWNKGYTGKGIVVTIVDDGMEHDHPDLKDNYDAVASTDLNGHDRDPYPNEADPINKHGTRCSGEIGAAKNDVCGIGIAYESSIGAVRMLDGDVTDAVEAGSLSLAPQHIDIYTNSWGPNDDGRTIEGPATLAMRAFQDGIHKGRNGKGSIYIFASGNGGSSDDCNADGYANGIFTIAISAIDENNNRPYYSENCASALASTYSSGGGRSITTTDLHKRCTSSHSGTSAAAPIAAGILALVLEANPNLTWRDVQHLLVHTSKLVSPTDSSWYTNKAGFHHSNKYVAPPHQPSHRALGGETVPAACHVYLFLTRLAPPPLPFASCAGSGLEAWIRARWLTWPRRSPSRALPKSGNRK